MFGGEQRGIPKGVALKLDNLKIYKIFIKCL